MRKALLFAPFPPRTKLNPLPQLTGPGRRAPQTRARLRDFLNAISVAAIATARCSVRPCASRAVCCRCGRAASYATFRINGVDIGLAAEQGALVRVSKLGGNASLSHEPCVLGAHVWRGIYTAVARPRVVPGHARCWNLRKSSRG